MSAASEPVVLIECPRCWHVIRHIQATGVTTLADLAEALNARGVASARGRRWHAMSVRNVLARGAAQRAQPDEASGRVGQGRGA